MLRLHLTARPATDDDAGVHLRSRHENTGREPIALTFWWTRSLRLTDSQGRVCLPSAGPVLPCGVAEAWTVLAPGEVIEREQPLQCTQPPGQDPRIGWSYRLAPGLWRATLIHEAPPVHGFEQCAPHPAAFRGRVESNEVTFTIAERPRGLIARVIRALARR